MKLFEIARDVDLDCVSDREILGTGVIFDNGVAVVSWAGDNKQFTKHDDIEEVLGLYAVDGNTRIFQTADIDFSTEGETLGKRLLHVEEDKVSDIIHDFLPWCCQANHEYMYKEREKFAKLFEKKEIRIGEQ
jgi:hypothetical protein